MRSPLQLQQCSVDAGFPGSGFCPQQGLGGLVEVETEGSTATRWAPVRNTDLMDFVCGGAGQKLNPEGCREKRANPRSVLG